MVPRKCVTPPLPSHTPLPSHPLPPVTYPPVSHPQSRQSNPAQSNRRHAFAASPQVWSSVRDWTASERERLDGYLEEARRAADEKRMSPGVPALISINNGGDRRRKRKMAWAVMAGGKPEDEEKLRVGCAGGGVSEVSRSELQPTQVCVWRFAGDRPAAL